MLLAQPARVGDLLREVLRLFEAGVFSPPRLETYPVSRSAEAFREIALAKHVGKRVLLLDDPEARVLVPTQTAPIRGDRSYLVTGGLGGLGLSLASWLVERGARHLVLVGRSGATTTDRQVAVTELRSRGASVTVAEADVADEQALRGVISAIDPRAPLGGVFHLAGTLDDALLPEQTAARLRTVIAAKALGAARLHDLTRDLPLDFFVLYSSAAGLLGSPGQANYAAANAFLDGLAHHRRALGLPAISIDWGSFSGVGLAAAQDNRAKRLAAMSVASLDPAQGLVALSRILLAQPTQVAVTPFDGRQWAEFYPAAAASPVISRLLGDARRAARPSAENTDLLARLAAASAGERADLVEGFLRGQISLVLRVAAERVDVEAPLTSLGMDSLMGLELRNRIERGLGIRLAATVLWTYPTIAAVAQHLLRELGLPPLEMAPDDDAPSADLDGMTDEDLAEMIGTEFSKIA
jgi:acyl carrier protein